MKFSKSLLNSSHIPFKVTPKKEATKGVKLLGPLELYRAILRSHRKLPNFQRDLGDKYVKAEFRLHRTMDNPVQIIGFLTEWQKYLMFVNKSTDQDWKQYKIDEATLEKMTDDQIHQLYGLLNETKVLFKKE